MKKDNVFKQLKNSIYNIKKMAIYSRQGVGRAILYALLFCAILGIGKATIISISLNSSINQIENLLEREKYNFKIANDKLEIKASPIKEELSGILVYIDDEKKLDEVKDLKKIMVNSDIYILILEDGIIINSNSSDYSLGKTELKYSELLIDEITNESLISALGFTKVILIIGTFFSSMLITFLYYLFNAVFIAVFIMLISSMYKVNLKYSESYSVVMYAATLPNILVFIFNIFMPTVYFSTVSIIGTILISVIIIKEISRNKLEKVV